MHDWFYCTRCLATFPTADARKAHRARQRCSIKCVTKTCIKYGTFPSTKCTHLERDSDTGDAVWMELFRTYRPGEPVPNPRMRRPIHPLGLTRAAHLPPQESANPPPTQSRRECPSIDPMRQYTSSAGSDSGPMVAPYSPVTDRTRALLTLAEQLWRHVHSQDRTISPLVRRLYEIATAPTSRVAETEIDHAASVLEVFVEQLWSLAQGTIERSNQVYEELLTLAQNWLHPAIIVSTLQLSIAGSTQNNLAVDNPSPLDGVGLQFLANRYVEQIPPASNTHPLRHHLTATHRVGNIQDQPHDPPWAIFPEAHPDSAQMQPYGPPVADSTTQPISSYGTMNSASMSSYDQMNRADTSMMNFSHSTNPTSANGADFFTSDSQNVRRPATSDGLAGTSFHGSSTGGFSPTSCAVFSQDDHVSNLDAID